MKVMRDPLVSIVVPNLNGIEHLETLLNSIMNTRYSEFEVIMVDDGSEDGSVDFVREHFPSVKTIENRRNVGVAATYNAGIAYSKGEFVSLLSNDMEVDPDWLKPLVNIMKDRPDVAAVDAWFLDYYDREKFDTVAAGGRYVDYFGNVFALGAGESHGDYENRVRRVFSAMALIRKNVIIEVGLIDSDFFFGYEDVDLFWRINLAGYNVLCTPSSRIYHKSGASSRRGEEREPGFYFLEKRNRLISVMKNLPRLSLILALPVILLEYASYMMFWTIEGNKRKTTELLHSLIWFLRVANLRDIWMKRMHIHSGKRGALAPLRTFLVPYCGDLSYLIRRGRTRWRNRSKGCNDAA